jgi:hypothetical protein
LGKVRRARVSSGFARVPRSRIGDTTLIGSPPANSSRTWRAESSKYSSPIPRSTEDPINFGVRLPPDRMSGFVARCTRAARASAWCRIFIARPRRQIVVAASHRHITLSAARARDASDVMRQVRAATRYDTCDTQRALHGRLKSSRGVQRRVRNSGRVRARWDARDSCTAILPTGREVDSARGPRNTGNRRNIGVWAFA